MKTFALGRCPCCHHWLGTHFDYSAGRFSRCPEMITLALRVRPTAAVEELRRAYAETHPPPSRPVEQRSDRTSQPSGETREFHIGRGH